MEYKDLKLNRFLQKQPQQDEDTKTSKYNVLYPAPKRNSTQPSTKGRIPGNEEDDGAPNVLTGTVITSCFIQTSALPSRIELAGNDLTFYDDTYLQNGEVIGDTSRLVFTHDLNSGEGFIMEKRASINDTYDNVISWYATPAKNDRYNIIFIGRDGRGDLTETRNLALLDITTNAKSSLGDTVFNGRIDLSVSVDQVEQKAELAIGWVGSLAAGNTGVFVNAFGSGDQSADDLGYGAIGYLDEATNTVLSAVAADKTGVQMVGIPTSSAGLPSGYIWSNAGVLTIVP